MLTAAYLCAHAASCQLLYCRKQRMTSPAQAACGCHAARSGGFLLAEPFCTCCRTCRPAARPRVACTLDAAQAHQRADDHICRLCLARQLLSNAVHEGELLRPQTTLLRAVLRERQHGGVWIHPYYLDTLHS